MDIIIKPSNILSWSFIKVKITFQKLIYHYPFLGVIVLVIFYDFIRQNYHKNLSDSYPFSLIMVNYPISL